MAGAAGGMTANPMQQASMAQQGALMGTARAGMTPIGTVAGSNLQQYQNPYTQQVIDLNTQDIMRGAQMGLNALGTQASQAGAFGGSRHGVAMGELGRNVLQQIGQQSAGLRQAGFQNAQQMAQADIQNRLAQANLGLSGASQLANLGQQSFGYGQAIQQNLQQQGQAQQAINQALIDAAKQQFTGYQQAPVSGLGIMTQALGASPHGQTQTSQRQLGLMDYLTAGASIYAASDVNLKFNIKRTGVLPTGVNTYTWDWNEEGQKITGQKSGKGVLAQEVRERFPEAVMLAKNGYLMVNYGHPKLKGAI